MIDKVIVQLSQTVATTDVNSAQNAGTALDAAVPAAKAALIASPPAGLVVSSIANQPYVFFYDGKAYNAIAVITYITAN